MKEIKAGMDRAVQACASANVGLGLAAPDKHEMPLCLVESEFDDLLADGWLMGLRPDQINSIRDVQPFAFDDFVGPLALQLMNGLDALESGQPLFAIWAAEARPQALLPVGFRVDEVSTDPAGVLDAPKRIATLRVRPHLPDGGISGNPNVYFDPILNVAPWPLDAEDNLHNHLNALLFVGRTLIQVLEESIDMTRAIRRLEYLDRSAPSVATEVWLPVNFTQPDQESEAREAIRESDQGMAVYSNDEGVMTYMALRDGRVVGREIPNASALKPGSDYGPAVEHATRVSAGRWGLPDFVLKPAVVTKGSGIREIGDGTIVSGRRGIALQVKARSTDTRDTPERAKSWLLKNAAAGLRQATGTIRTTFQNGPMALENLRGRTIQVVSGKVEWVRVVVLDHPNPPLGIVPPLDGGGPSVVMLRRDWEFLWNQLQSASAVVDYIHRVSTEPEAAELGSETHRYFDLADKDFNAPQSNRPQWMTDALGPDQESGPLLPKDPASAPDELGYRVFQRILEDVAATDFTGDETARVDMLAQVDRVAVTHRAELGRLLLRRLVLCGQVEAGSLRAEHRILYVDNGDLHLSFTCMGKLTGYYQEVFRTWFLHRRQRFLSQSGSLGPVWPWSIGILLTPRPGDARLWDTTVLATNGPPHFDDKEEFERLDEHYASVAPRA